jgi:hypothetical protein
VHLWHWRRRIDAGFETAAFVFEGVELYLQRLALAVERHATLRQTQAGVLLRRLHIMSRRIVAIQPNNPVGEGRERCAAVVVADLQLLQAGEVALPCLNQVAALVIDFRIGLLASFRCGLYGALSFVARVLALCMQGFGLRHIGMASPQQYDLFASINDQGAKVAASIVEGLWRQCDQIGRGERCERATGVQASDTCRLGMRRAVLT